VVEWIDVKPTYSAKQEASAFKRQILGVGGLALVSTKQNESEDGVLALLVSPPDPARLL
jgi:hypothetical protein